MENESRIFKNSIFISGSVVANGILIFLTIVIIARYLGAEAFGQLSLMLAITSILQLFADGGIISITIRNISTNKSRLAEIVGYTLTIMMALSLCLLAIALMFIYFFDDHSFDFKVSLIMMLLAGFAMLQGLVHGAAIRAMEDMGITAVISIAHKLLLFVMVWIVVVFDSGIIGVAAVHLLSNVFYWQALSRVVKKKYIKVKYLVDWQKWRILIKDSVPLGAAMMLRKLTVHLDTLLLVALATVAAVGIYSSAYRILQMVEIAAIALSGVLFPVLSRLAKDNFESLVILFNQAFLILLVIALPLSIWFSLAAENLIMVFYGQEFINAQSVLTVLGLALVFPVLTSLNHPVFAALGEQRWLMYAALIGLLLNIILDIVLIPHYSYFGAAVGTAITEALMCVVGVVMLSKKNINLINYKKILGVVAASLLAGFVYKTLPNESGIVAEIIRLGVMTGIYFLSLALFKVVTADEIASFLRGKKLFKAPGVVDDV